MLHETQIMTRVELTESSGLESGLNLKQ